jgi:vancomycin resistance protein YoaR
VITQALGTLEPVAMDLPTQVAPADVTAKDLEPVIATVNSTMNRSMRVTFENRVWRVDGLALVPYLTVENVVVDGEPTVELGFDKQALASALRELYAGEINRDPVNATVRWDNAVGLVATSASVNGITVNGGAFATAVAEGFLGGSDEVKIPTVILHPDIDSNNLGALGINSVLATGDSNFVGGTWERDENIRVGASLLNGTLVRPGAYFSFNDAIGEITYDKGYQDAAVVVAEQVGRDVGGGVCQVSTTVFRAALLAGMPIGEWHHHTYRLSGYELDGWGPGFDAAILQYGSNPGDWADFTFENFTDGWLYIQAYTDGTRLYVSIYGTDTGRSVSISKWGMNGKSTGFNRVIYDADGNVVADRDFYTTFK